MSNNNNNNSNNSGLREFESTHKKPGDSNNTKNNVNNDDKFQSNKESVEESLKKNTIGLVHLQDFKLKRKEIEEAQAREAAKTNEINRDERPKKKKKKDKNLKLSFLDDDDNHADSNESVKKISKNPQVDTTFLPDREREDEERKERERLRVEFLKKQEELKAEDIEIQFAYWDGQGHRSSVVCKKGDTIAQFLSKSRSKFAELKNTQVDNLMYIKEDLIIPPHYTFYDFIINKARGKSGPLFNFDVHDDVRLVNDARIEKNESHAGKVVERAWYNRNKHIFPASRWEVYDPKKDYGTYSIKDKKIY